MTFNKKEWHKEYHLKNKEYHNKCRKEWRLKNPERTKEYQKEWHLKNTEYLKEWYLKNPGYYKKWQNNKVRTDPNFRLRRNLGKRLWAFLKGVNKSASTMKLIGCTLEQLWVHLESSPKWEPWMTRENYGRSGGWDIDHIKACAKFDSTNPAHQRECMNWSNLQPMEHIANIKKGRK